MCIGLVATYVGCETSVIMSQEPKKKYKRYLEDGSEEIPSRTKRWYSNDEVLPTVSSFSKVGVSRGECSASHSSCAGSGRISPATSRTENEDRGDSIDPGEDSVNEAVFSDDLVHNRFDQSSNEILDTDEGSCDESINMTSSEEQDTAVEARTGSGSDADLDYSGGETELHGPPPSRMTVCDRNLFNRESHDSESGVEQYDEENEEETVSFADLLTEEDLLPVDHESSNTQDLPSPEGRREEAEQPDMDALEEQPAAPAGVGDVPIQPASHAALFKALGSEYFTSVITTAVCVSPAEILLMVLSLFEQNNLSFKAFVDMAKLVNSIFVSDVIENSQYLLDKLLLASSGFVRYFYCGNCSYYFGHHDHTVTHNLPCPECSTINHIKDLTKATYFLMYTLQSQLEQLFINKEVWESLVDPKEAVKQSQPNVLKDVYDGKCYRKFVDSLSADDFPEKIISLVFCTDGSPLFKSSNFSIWPILLAINELPPLIRMRNLLLGGLWFGSKHPPMDLYLKPFVDHMTALSTGFKIKLAGIQCDMRAFLLACCADSGARGAVQGINSHSGYFSCNWCEIAGEYVDHKVVFPFQENPPKLRTRQDLENYARECLGDDRLFYVFGVQYLCPLSKCPKFDAVEGMIVDFFHNGPLGIGRSFLDYWLKTTSRSFYIGSPHELLMLDERMKKLTPCIEVRRAVRMISVSAHWKGREFENWTMFYSLIVLADILPPTFYNHWCLFVQAMYLLSRQSVTHEYVNTAHALIMHFVSGVKRLYGKAYMLFNIHILTHLAQNVARWGPLWAVSTYCFESYLGWLKKLLHALRGVSNQIHRALSYKQAKRILINFCATPRTERFLESVKSKPNKQSQELPLKDCVAHGSYRDFVPNDEENFLLESSCHAINVNYCSVYSKVISSRCVYVSEPASYSRFNNSFALTNSDDIVLIKKFIVDRESERAYLFCVSVTCETILRFPVFLKQIAFIA